MILTSAGPIDKARAARGEVREWLNKPVRFSELWDALVRRAAPRGAGAAPIPTPRSGAPADAIGGRILVVEDNRVNQMVADGVLRKIGYDADIAANGIEALEALSQRSYDLVLMDCHMPEMDGYEATIELRRREIGGRRTPVIAMTAGVLDDDKQRCTDAGMDGFVGKPINIGLLKQTLSKWAPSAPAVASQRSPRPNKP